MACLILGACRDVQIYLAGPLFSEAERRFNLRLTHRLEALGFEVFLPQRDGVERDRPPYGENLGSRIPGEQDYRDRHADSNREGGRC